MRRSLSLLFSLAILAALSLAADPQLLSKVPGKAEALVGVNVRAVLGSGIGQELLNSAKSESKDLNEFIALTGLDPRTDVNEILIAAFPSNGAAPNTAGESAPKLKTNTLVLMSGVFTPARLSSALASNGAKKSMYKGQEIWTPDAKTNKDGDVVSFLSGNLVAAGNAERVKQVIDGQSGALSANLQRRVSDVSGRFDVWMVSTISPAKVAGAVDAPGAAGEATGALQGDMFQKIESAQGGVKFGPTVNIALEMNATTAEDATALMNVLQFFRGMLQSGGQSKQGAQGAQSLAKLLNSINMSTQAKTVSLSMNLAEADVINFLKTAQKRTQQKAEAEEKQQEEIVIIQ